MVNYYLPEHVHFCAMGSSVIFLDLRRDEYSLINGGQAAAFLGLVAGVPGEKSVDGTASEFLQPLLAAGLLVTEHASGRAITPTEAFLPARTLVTSPEVAVPIRIRVRDLWNFVSSCIRASLHLRLRPIELTVRRVRERKGRHTQTALSPAEVRRCVMLFNRLRLFYPRDYLCLFDSLSLIDFLAHYDIYPDWVFAVRFEPWAAHCWVQQGEMLFNDDLEKTEEFMPILQV